MIRNKNKNADNPKIPENASSFSNEIPSGSAARFKGILTKEEAGSYHEYLKQARNEWGKII